MEYSPTFALDVYIYIYVKLVGKYTIVPWILLDTVDGSVFSPVEGSWRPIIYRVLYTSNRWSSPYFWNHQLQDLPMDRPYCWWFFGIPKANNLGCVYKNVGKKRDCKNYLSLNWWVDPGFLVAINRIGKEFVYPFEPPRFSLVTLWFRTRGLKTRLPSSEGWLKGVLVVGKPKLVGLVSCFFLGGGRVMNGLGGMIFVHVWK